MENNAQTPHAIANEVTELIFNPWKKNGPKSVVQKNVICILTGWYFHYADRNTYCTGAICRNERNVLAFKSKIIFNKIIYFKWVYIKLYSAWYILIKKKLISIPIVDYIKHATTKSVVFFSLELEKPQPLNACNRWACKNLMTFSLHYSKREFHTINWKNWL